MSAEEKFLEEKIANQLDIFIEKHKKSHQSQHGFQKSKSTEKLLGEFIYTVNRAVNRNQHVLVIFVDFCKEFDIPGQGKL